jgi:hypothetical protein
MNGEMARVNWGLIFPIFYGKINSVEILQSRKTGHCILIGGFSNG